VLVPVRFQRVALPALCLASLALGCATERRESKAGAPRARGALDGGLVARAGADASASPHADASAPPHADASAPLRPDASGASARPNNDAVTVDAGDHPTQLPDGIAQASLLPARVRRLSNAEYDATVQALLATERSPAKEFPPDLRQDGFTVNANQRIDAVVVERLMDAADRLATEAQENGTLAELAPCDGSEPRVCARDFIESFGARAYRRPLDDDEVDALLALYDTGADGAEYEDGIAHVVRGLLQSAGFLYLTELGDGDLSESGAVQLGPYELASAMSYLLTSGPPDDTLLAKARTGALSEPATRAAEARRLFDEAPGAKDTAVRWIREWLGIDRVDESAKDTLVYPNFPSDKPSIVAESRDFVRAVAFESTGTVSELFGATWTVGSGPLGLYQQDGPGPIDGSVALTDRVGILNQAAFLTRYATATESHPVFRGVALARRVVCLHLDSPASFNIQVVPPLPDPTLTTRERYDVHSRDEICTGCHEVIDPFGFSFEHFDGMGAYRDLDNGKPVDSSVELLAQSPVDGEYADSNELARALSKSDDVSECFARFMYRAAAAAGDQAATPGESEFLDFWHTLPKDARGNLVDTLIATIQSPYFGWRDRL
jgi:hypothetical protein